MNIHLEETPSHTLAKLSGEFEIDDAAQIAEMLQPIVDQANAGLIVDLSGLKQINSAGLGELIALITRSRLSGSHVVIVNPSPFVRQVFNVTRLDTWLEIYEDETAAVAALRD